MIDYQETLRCLRADIETNLFTPGEEYDLHDGPGLLHSVIDNLGHTRYVNLAEPLWLLGADAAGQPAYAHFTGCRAGRDGECNWDMKRDEKG